MGLGEDILSILSDSPTGHTFPRLRDKHRLAIASANRTRKDAPRDAAASGAAIRVTLSRLKSKGFVENNRGAWLSTESGIKHLAAKLAHQSVPKTTERKPKNLIIAFDVPEIYATERRWLREQLKNLGFEMLQKSVWFGPAPLPRKFLQSVESLQLLAYMRFFEARPKDVI